MSEDCFSEDRSSEDRSSEDRASIEGLHHATNTGARERGYARRSRAVRLLEQVLSTGGMSADDLASALVVPRNTLDAYRDGRSMMPLERQLCLALLVIERVPALARQAHRLHGQVVAEAAFNARSTKTHMIAPVSKHWR
jgi:hypothetical protein